MISKSKKNKKSQNTLISNNASKEYTTIELIELGQKYNRVQIAQPILKEKVLQTVKEQDT